MASQSLSKVRVSGEVVESERSPVSLAPKFPVDLVQVESSLCVSGVGLGISEALSESE